LAAASNYDTIGLGYSEHRRADPAVAATIRDALGGASSVLNVGAGAGSYEPADRNVVAVEPSSVMLTQRPRASAPAVQARAEALPFGKKSFDAVMGVLTIQHWTDRLGGIRECVRVARDRVVLLTWDPFAESFWLTRDYLPQITAVDRERFSSIASLAEAFGPSARVDVTPVPIRRDCVDGFLGAFWARPDAYLDAGVRAGMSTFARPGAEKGLERLRADLASGVWQAKYGDLLAHETLDIGYRLVTASVK
jgi:SAM-dependent methyltransferase